MNTLICGLLLWSIVHFYPAVMPSSKAGFVYRFGQPVYKGIFALLIILSLVLIVFGWRNIESIYLYTLPDFIHSLMVPVHLIVFILFIAAKLPTRIKQLMRHPQLSSVVLWACTHILLNGDSRSLLLFGWLGAWALIEMLLINKREGQWIKPAPASWAQDVICVVAGIILFVVVVLLHPYLSGIALQ